MRSVLTFVLAGLFSLSALAPATSATASKSALLAVVSFNVESDRDTDPALVAQQIAKISRSADVDLFGLAEVRDADDAETFKRGAERDGAKFRYILAQHGNEDRVAILYNLATLKFKDSFELDRFPGSRKALVARFRHKAAGLEFLFVANHFNRGDADRRQRQAKLIRDWALDQDLPVVLVGDYNFDYDPLARRGNKAYDIFTSRKGLTWIEPECVAKRTCPPTGTQCDRRYNSIMDFVFVADQERGWQGLSDVLFGQQQDYCKAERSGGADHRPVLGVIEVR